MLLKAFLFFQLLHVVNQLHFKWETGIPGVALTNVIFLAVVVLLQSAPETVTAKPILQRPLLFFFGAITVAFLWGQVRAPGELIDDLTYYKNALFFPLFYFLFLKCRQDAKTTRWLIIWVLVIAAVAGLEGLREGIEYGFGKYNAFHRASGPFGDDWHNANRAGVFYGMFMPMFVALVLFLKKRKLWRLAAVGGCIVLVGGAVSTYSRQAYVLVIIAVAVLLLRKSLLAAVAIGVILVALTAFLPEAVFQRVEETHQESKTGEEEVDASTSSRWELWAGGMRMLSANPLGVGLNRWRAEIGAFCRYKKMDAHNFYMLTLGEMGPLGLASLLYLFYSLFVLARFLRDNRPPDDPELHALTVGFTICTVNTCLGCIYGSPTFEGSVMAPYWALCGLLERYIHLRKAEAGEPPAAVEAQDPIASRFPLAGFIAPGRRNK
jgi:O-antigen ligase